MDEALVIVAQERNNKSRDNLGILKPIFHDKEKIPRKWDALYKL